MQLWHYLRNLNVVFTKVRVLPRVLAAYFKVHILRRPVLRTLELTLTPECNIACEMCYATKLKRPGQSPLQVDEYRRIWQEAKALGAFSAVLSGGEPTLRKDLFAIISVLEPERTIIGLVSNGTLLDEDFLQKLRQHGVRVLHLSLNSTEPGVNDRERDFPGHFEKVCSLIESSKRLGIQVCLSTVVSHGEIDRFAKVIEFARQNSVGVSVSLACPAGEWENSQEHLLDEQEVLQVEHMMNTSPHVRADWTINLSCRKECPGGREKLCISPFGDVMSCGMNFISFGNVRTSSLSDIWNQTQQWPPFRQRSKRCLISINREYLKEYLIPVVSSPTLPLPVDQHPVHPWPILGTETEVDAESRNAENRSEG